MYNKILIIYILVNTLKALMKGLQYCQNYQGQKISKKDFTNPLFTIRTKRDL